MPSPHPVDGDVKRLARGTVQPELEETDMCQRTTCKTCRKPSWRGCGAHVESVLGDVAPADRCICSATASPKSSWLGQLLNR